MQSASQGLNLMYLCICLDGFVKDTSSLCAPHPVVLEQQGTSDPLSSLALTLFTTSFSIFLYVPLVLCFFGQFPGPVMSWYPSVLRFMSFGLYIPPRLFCNMRM